jgi:squalene-hopene/tetraprenyl-beta-curcumene cyclase
LSKRGTIASPDGSLDFPTYASALWLSGRSRLNLKMPEAERKKVIDYLIGAQVAEPRGFAPDSPSYGGWDFLGPGDAQSITTGTNVSVTCYVAEALGESGVGSQESVIQRALTYVHRCQQPDGGFAFTCEPMSLNNKAAYADDNLKEPRSYGTATCDGIRALLACGTKPDDERIIRAVTWLAKRPSLEAVPGFEGLPPEAGWQRGLRHYYYASLARVLPLFPAADVDARREALAKHLIGLQEASGRWVNESDRMRENDPLIATSLAVVALAGTIH